MPHLSILQTGGLSLLIFLAGFVDSIAGGGGIISLPAYFAAGLPAHMALGTNKFSSFVGTFTAVFRYHKANLVNWRVGLWAAAGSLAGAALGARLALLVPAPVIQTVLIVLVPMVLVFLLLKDRLLPASSAAPGSAIPRLSAKSLIIGAVIGTYDGFFGPGTGTFLAIAFYSILNLNLVEASADARLANLASNAGALAVFMWNGQVAFPLALVTGASGIAGNFLGSRLALQKGERIIKPLMTVVLVLLLLEVIRRRLAAGV